jgi:hypothetical protein
MSHMEWLRQLRPLDHVAVHIGASRVEVAQVTSTSRTLITIGKYAKRTNFSRSTGMMCGRKPMGHLFRIERP